jgi:hypothetical protein
MDAGCVSFAIFSTHVRRCLLRLRGSETFLSWKVAVEAAGVGIFSIPKYQAASR